MIKKILLPIIVLVSTNFFAQGQTCIPNAEQPDSVVVDPLPFTQDNPMSGITDTACANMYFETVLQLNLPESVVVAGNELGLAGATMETEGAITNLPASLAYICNPPNCEFSSTENGCLVIYGTPTDEEIGQHDLILSTVLNLTIANLPFDLPDGTLVQGNYYLHVQEEGSPNCFMTALPEVVENAFDLRIQPNPLSDYAAVFVNLPQADDYTFTVYNTLGNIVKQEQQQLQAGENYFHFDGSDLPVGMFIFTLQNETQAASGRLLIQR